MQEGTKPSRLRVWLAGLVVGVASGFSFAAWPTLGAIIAIAFAVPATISRSRPAALGGLLVGIPAMWLGVIALATMRCADFNAQPGQECIAPDLTSWIGLAIAILGVGVVLSILAYRRAARGS